MNERIWAAQCILCGFGLDTGHCCNRCVTRLRDQLVTIERLVHDAACQIVPAHKPGAGSHSFGSKPPIDVAAVDPELSMVELNAGDPTSAVPLLDMLEMWERAVREDRHMAPYGVATASAPAGTGSGTQSTLAHVVGFLTAHTDWMTTDPRFGLEDYADQLKRAVKVLKRWDPDNDDHGVRVSCPTTLDDGTQCGWYLYVTQEDTTTCRRCQRTWNREWLIEVADKSDVWVDAEVIEHRFRVAPRTLRDWVVKGHVRRKGGLFNVDDVTILIKPGTSAGFARLAAKVRGTA